MISLTQKHTHLQAAQISPIDQSLQKSVLFSILTKLKNKKFPSLLKNKTSQTHTLRQTDMNIHGRLLTTLHLQPLLVDTDGGRAATNSTYTQGGVSCLSDTFVQTESSVLRTNFCAKKPALRVAANRYHQCYDD
jgi:hypothetical protein